MINSNKNNKNDGWELTEEQELKIRNSIDRNVLPKPEKKRIKSKRQFIEKYYDYIRELQDEGYTLESIAEAITNTKENGNILMEINVQTLRNYMYKIKQDREKAEKKEKEKQRAAKKAEEKAAEETAKKPDIDNNDIDDDNNN